MSKSEMKNGTVKFFNTNLGWGIITSDFGKDIYVHFTGIETTVGKKRAFRTLTAGERVAFELEQGPKGLMAVRVIRIKIHERKLRQHSAELDKIFGPVLVNGVIPNRR